MKDEQYAAKMESTKGKGRGSHLHKLHPQIIYQEAQSAAAYDSNETYAKRQVVPRPSVVTAAKPGSKYDVDYKLYNRQIQLREELKHARMLGTDEKLSEEQKRFAVSLCKMELTQLEMQSSEDKRQMRRIANRLVDLRHKMTAEETSEAEETLFDIDD